MISEFTEYGSKEHYESREIENDITAPEEEKPKSRARKSAPKAKKEKPASELIAALKFISVCQKKNGEIYQQHCMLSGGWVAAMNEYMVAATPINASLTCCPHTLQLIEALNKCESEFQMVMSGPETLSIASGYFTAVINCTSPELLNIHGPDLQCGAITDDLKPALGVCSSLLVENSPNEYTAAVLMQANTCVGTDGVSMVEVFHGIDLPPSMLIPKSVAVAVSKTDKKLTAFGFSAHSFTFYFEDGSFIKSRLFTPQYPNYLPLMECSGKPKAIHKEFFTALETIKPFCESGQVYFKDGYIYSLADSNIASSYKFGGLPDGLAFSCERLLHFKTQVKKGYFDKENRKAFLFSDTMRAVVMGLSSPKEFSAAVDNSTEADDIPF